jgi:hypothetical protein
MQLLHMYIYCIYIYVAIHALASMPLAPREQLLHVWFQCECVHGWHIK